MVVAVISYFQQNLAGHAEIFGESTRTRGLACVSTRWTSINVRADARDHDAGQSIIMCLEHFVIYDTEDKVWLYLFC